MKDGVVEDVVGEIVRRKTKEKGSCTRDELEAEIQQLRGLAEERRENGRIDFSNNRNWFSWKIIHARKNKAYIHVEGTRGDRIEAGRSGSLDGELKRMEFNTEKYDIDEEIIDLSQFKKSSQDLPEEVKQDLDAVYENSENNRGSFTRLFGLKCFFDLDKEKVSDDELGEAVKRRYKASMPGTKSSYMSYRGKAFTSEKYSSFIEEDGFYRIDPEFEDSREEIKQYVYHLWDRVDKSPDYFMVLQKKENELENEYLEASADDSEPSHYLEKLSEGDIVIHYFSPDKEVIGYSEVVEEAYEKSEGKLRVGVDLQRFDKEINRDDIIPKLKDERGKLDKYYVLNKSGDLNEGYLFEITEEAAKFIQNGAKGQEAESYFWVTADPSIWKVSELESGDKKFYPAYLPSGNKARIFSNFEEASEGDRVVFYQSTPVKKVVAEGVVDEGLHQEEAEGYDDPVEGVTLEYTREIEGDISWSQLKEIPDLEDAKPVINTAQGSIFKLEKDEFETILSLEAPSKKDESNDIEVDEKLEIELSDDLLGKKYLHFPDGQGEEIVSQIESALNSGKHIIFTGPPGTGKTEIAEAVASELED
ncbi:MAG: EVE domain-containing protein, partial [Candidatus Nanohalobium sp.]